MFVILFELFYAVHQLALKAESGERSHYVTNDGKEAVVKATDVPDPVQQAVSLSLYLRPLRAKIQQNTVEFELVRVIRRWPLIVFAEHGLAVADPADCKLFSLTQLEIVDLIG